MYEDGDVVDALGNGISRASLGTHPWFNNQPKGINAAQFEEHHFKEGSVETSKEMFKHCQLNLLTWDETSDLFVSNAKYFENQKQYQHGRLKSTHCS